MTQPFYPLGHPGGLTNGNPHAADGPAVSIRSANRAGFRAVRRPRLRPLAAGLASLAVAGAALAQGTPPADTNLVIRARGVLLNNVGPIVDLYVNGAKVGTTEVRATSYTDYSVRLAAALKASDKVDVVFTNDQSQNGVDRNLYLAYVKQAATTLLPITPGTTYDRGSGSKAFDGLDVVAGQGEMYWHGALRFTWPAAPGTSGNLARKNDASRFLQQASFGATTAEIDKLAASTNANANAAWIDQQLALPVAAPFVPYVEGKFSLGTDWRPKGAKYTNNYNLYRFWNTANTAPDQLRKRMAFALYEIFVVSNNDSNLYNHARPFARYLDNLDKHALGNFRNLIQDVSLSPVMGMYLSHLRNPKEDPATGRMPDENFARELMQLFTIGLHELNADGTPVLDAAGKPIETYNNNDVMALAKVFTGWSWGFPDNELTSNNFKWGNPDYSVANDRRIDLNPMKPYPGQHSTAEKRLFAGKPWGVTIPANGTAEGDLKTALDTLFNHPNVGPFISRQLIQHLVTSQPSPAYVGRVAAVFNNNGKGVRGDLGAVAKAILLDSEARTLPAAAGFGKLREPIMRVTQWMRAFGATSVTGDYMITSDMDALSQRPFSPSSVFSYFRPGYIPPGTAMAAAGATAPEFQIVNESTTAAWANVARSMTSSGLGWSGSTQDVTTTMAAQVDMVKTGNVNTVIDNINLLLFAGTMSAELKQDLLDAIGGVTGTDDKSQGYRARIALLVALASSEYLVQR